MRLRIVALVLAGLVVAGPPGAAETQPGYRALFEKLWSTVDANYYDPGFHGVDWKAAGARYRARLGRVKTDKDFDALASAMLGEIGTSHLYIVAPSGSPAAGTGIGVRFEEMDGAQVVSSVAALSDARAQGVQLGDKLLSPRAALTGETGTTANIRLEDCEGKARGLAVRRVAAFWPPPHPGFEWSSAKISPGRTIGYLRIDRFDDGAASLADRAMEELKDTSGLVIDLRGNSGGNASALRLQSYFANGEAPAFALLARPYLERLGHKVGAADILEAPKVTGAYSDEAVFAAVSAHGGAVTFWSEDVGARRYTRPVIVLVGEDTGSAAEGFAWTMHGLPQVTFVGRRTAGALLSGAEFPLPGGWTVTVPVQGVWGADGTDYLDRAIAPDRMVAWTRDDLCRGRDPDIAQALSLLAAP